MRKINLLMIYPILVLLIGCNDASKPNSSKANLPNWQPDQTFVDQLGAYKDFDGYQIRPPKGYVSGASPSTKQNARALAWRGDVREDGSQPWVTVILLSSPTKEYSLAQLSEAMLNNLKNDKVNWQQTPTEKGIVNGITFLKTNWQGQDSHTKSKMHGTEYVGEDGSTFIEIKVKDSEPHDAQSLKIGEASILTFRKK